MVNQHFVATENEETAAGEVANIWEVLGRRWSLLILKNLCSKEVIRFNEFKKLLSGISGTCFGGAAIGAGARRSCFQKNLP